MMNTRYPKENKELNREMQGVLELQNRITMSKTPGTRPIKQGTKQQTLQMIKGLLPILKSVVIPFLPHYPHQTKLQSNKWYIGYSNHCGNLNNSIGDNFNYMTKSLQYHQKKKKYSYYLSQLQ